MKKFRVYGILSASVVIGEYEAENEQDAMDKADNDPKANWSATLCHHCAGNIDIGVCIWSQ